MKQETNFGEFPGTPVDSLLLEAQVRKQRGQTKNPNTFSWLFSDFKRTPCMYDTATKRTRCVVWVPHPFTSYSVNYHKVKVKVPGTGVTKKVGSHPVKDKTGTHNNTWNLKLSVDFFPVEVFTTMLQIWVLKKCFHFKQAIFWLLSKLDWVTDLVFKLQIPKLVYVFQVGFACLRSEKYQVHGFFLKNGSLLSQCVLRVPF